MLRYVAVCSFAFLLTLFPASAQNTGRLAGSVMDATGAAVPGATVQLVLSSGGVAASTLTTTEGLFSFSGIRPETYDVVIEAKGFTKKTVKLVKVDPGRETSMPGESLEVGATSEVVEVTESAQGIQTTNAEVSTTITTEQMRRLPMLNRSPLALITTQAGVTSNGRTNTTINGQRPSFANVTFDGINVQDNYIRTNALDFLPNLLLLDEVAEVTVLTSNSSAAVGGGASQTIFVSPSGSNTFRGSAYWSNRNRALAANDWFDNRDGIKQPPYNQNQGGGAFGGRIIRDKLFFYGNYEAYRLHRQGTYNTTVLTQDARQGIYTYRDSGGAVRKANLLQLAGQTADPTVASLIQQIPGPDKINNFRSGDSSEALLRNTAGYSYARRNNRIRNNAIGKLDYIHSTRHVFTGTYKWNSDLLDRPGEANNYELVPAIKNDNNTNFLSLAWRWNPGPSFTNELRGGFNRAPGLFVTDGKYPEYFVGGLLFSNPLNVYRPQGRYTNTYSFQDNANYTRGRHNFQFGFQSQMLRIKSFTSFDTIPTYTLGIGTGNTGLTTAQLPGISATDLAGANNLLANMAGLVTSYVQSYNVTGRTSGFVPGASNTRNYVLNNYAAYFQDNWRVLPRLSLNLGLRWDYYSPTDERDALALLPVLQNGNAISTLLSNSTLDFAGSAVGRPWYNKDFTNFAPVAGLAWDVFGDGRTALRAAYSLSYVNDELIVAARNNINTNAGLEATSQRSGLSASLRNRPAIPTPAFKVPRTFAENFALNPTGNAQGMPDPNLRTPYVQQWSIGIQQRVKGAVVEIRYVGNHTTKAWRAFDYNQVIIKNNGFLTDFQKAYNNGLLALARNGRFLPAYNAGIAGSQTLPVFDRLSGGGLLTNTTVINLIQQQQAGELANIYFTNDLAGDVNFYRNSYGLGMNMLTNYSNASYNGLQIDARKQTTKGLYLQGNYTWSKNLSDAAGDGQTRFEAFLDLDNARIERSRTPFDLAHQIKINSTYELPMGAGHTLSSPKVNRVLGGWFVSGIYTWQTGQPFSVLSGRGTLNRGARSGQNTANSSLTLDQLEGLLQVRQTGVGPYFLAASAINPADGRAVAPDTSAAFSGQVFTQPVAGSIGSLQRRMFSGPAVWNLDASIGKRTRITEKQSLEIRMDSVNILNHPTWYIGDQTITSTQFSRITTTFFDRRLIQFGATYRF